MEIVTIKKVIEETKIKYVIGDIIRINTDKYSNQIGIIVSIDQEKDLYYTFIFNYSIVESFEETDIDTKIVYHIPLKDPFDITRYKIEGNVVKTEPAIRLLPVMEKETT